MSGGVDSSVAAALLIEQGYDVIGVTMNLFSLPPEYCQDDRLKSCCGWGAIETAHKAAAALGIPHDVVDLKRDFSAKVISDFAFEYSHGRTPNPCIRCNQFIKFEVLLQRARKLGADFIATGHHARVELDRRSSRCLLRKGKDQKKDQSYFLYTMTQEQLASTLMPVGDYTKNDIREKARSLNLTTAERQESQEICFVPDDDYTRFLADWVPEAFHPGPIVDVDGKVLGQHRGIVHFTIGQRRGIGVAAPEPLYVLDIRADEQTVVVGGNDMLYREGLVASHLNYISLEKVEHPLQVKARIRYKHEAAAAVLTPLEPDKVLVRFASPQRAVTPGQAVVFYQEDTVVGGGTIERVLDTDE
jgi:tRNA-specific 2-thiouridylase